MMFIKVSVCVVSVLVVLCNNRKKMHNHLIMLREATHDPTWILKNREIIRKLKYPAINLEDDHKGRICV